MNALIEDIIDTTILDEQTEPMEEKEETAVAKKT